MGGFLSMKPPLLLNVESSVGVTIGDAGEASNGNGLDPASKEEGEPTLFTDSLIGGSALCGEDGAEPTDLIFDLGRESSIGTGKMAPSG
jgi:hypothetical protein